MTDLTTTLRTYGPAMAAVLGALALLAALTPPVLHGLRRRGQWLADPRKLLDPAPRSPLLNTAVVGAAVATGMLACWLRSGTATPLGPFLAACACFITEHRRGGRIAGLLGFLLVSAGLAVAAESWLPAFGENLLLGLGVAGLYLLWLARFWEQQLLDGAHWTTAGRLILVARCAAYVTTLAALIVSLSMMQAGAAEGGLRISGWMTLGILLVLSAALGLTVWRARGRWATLAAVAAVAAAVALLLRPLNT